MKNTLWANHLYKSTVSEFNRAGFFTNEDFDNVPVIGLLLLLGVDREDVDKLLKALYFEENTWRIGNKDILVNATENEGREYLSDIFIAYQFDEHPEYFYKMTVRALLELEFIEERFIPFVTAHMQRYLNENFKDSIPFFIDKKDIEEEFEEIIGEIKNPIPADEIIACDKSDYFEEYDHVFSKDFDDLSDC